MKAQDKSMIKKSLAKSEKCLGKVEKLCRGILSWSPAKRRAAIKSLRDSIKDVKADTADIKAKNAMKKWHDSYRKISEKHSGYVEYD